jgi:hypothetical protein
LSSRTADFEQTRLHLLSGCNGDRIRDYPLEKHDEIDGMKADGHDPEDWSQHLLKMVRRIKEAEERRKTPEPKRRQFLIETFSDFCRKTGSIDIICPYCLGRMNHNVPRDQGAVLCGWYDLVTGECSLCCRQFSPYNKGQNDETRFPEICVVPYGGACHRLA